MPVVVLTGRTLSPAEVARVAAGEGVMLDPAARARMAAGAGAWDAGPDVLVEKRRWLVGGEAGEGDRVREFVLGHCCGVGPALPTEAVRALMVCRANVLAIGVSGVRPEVVEALLAMLNHRVHPVVPSQGSVGAAGDLAPLAHVARVLCGYGGAVEGGASPLPPLVPTSKEALALINGATLTAALGALAVHRSTRLVHAFEGACAMSLEALRANPGCLDGTALHLRGHPGGQAVAHRLRGLLAGSELLRPDGPADAFSLRAAPAVLGALREALQHTEQVVVRELNGACDNPLWVDGRAVEAGNFHGAPVALSLDHLRAALVQAASQSERRTYRLANGDLTEDLPSFLVEGTGLNSGLMLAQYTAASLVSECKGLAFPAVVDSIPTAQHLEDHVSMGPIAARLTLRVVDAVAEVVGTEALFAAQALDFRRDGVRFPGGVREQGAPAELAGGIAELHARVRARVARWHDDQIMEPALRAMGELVRAGELGGKPGPW